MVADLMRLDVILREGRKRRRTFAPTSESSLAAEQDRNLAWERRRLTEADLAEKHLRAEKDLAWERRRLTEAEISSILAEKHLRAEKDLKLNSERERTAAAARRATQPLSEQDISEQDMARL